MATNAETAYASFKAVEGQTEGTGDWFDVSQEQVDHFADVTHDHQFIHVDPEAAKATPFGGTIAHGFLTLSMLTHLTASIPQDMSRFAGILMGVNYGFEKVRFVAPVPTGSRIRATSVLSKVELKDPNTVHLTRTVTVEIEGQDKPACVAEWVTRLVYG
ncbi:MAG: MaoC family dehydratase [Acidimicrobiales bacterium]